MSVPSAMVKVNTKASLPSPVTPSGITPSSTFLRNLSFRISMVAPPVFISLPEASTPTKEYRAAMELSDSCRSRAFNLTDAKAPSAVAVNRLLDLEFIFRETVFCLLLSATSSMTIALPSPIYFSKADSSTRKPSEVVCSPPSGTVCTLTLVDVRFLPDPSPGTIFIDLSPAITLFLFMDSLTSVMSMTTVLSAGSKSVPSKIIFSMTLTCAESSIPSSLYAWALVISPPLEVDRLPIASAYCNTIVSDSPLAYSIVIVSGLVYSILAISL